MPFGLPLTADRRARVRSFFNSPRLFALIILLAAWAWGRDGYAQVITEEEVAFQSGDITLHGTVLIPERSEPGPAIALVHGAGLGRREDNRRVAEALAREGMLVLIYDKRTEGYAADVVGDRSYELLADDAIAAVQLLQQREDVDPLQVGLWGLSEGGWVAPLAATRSDDVAFVITVAGGGIGPAEQTAWATEGALRRRGVTSEGALRALADHTFRFLVSAELFAEGMFDPVPVLRELQQPILAIWGSMDQIMPATASAQTMQEALEPGDNPHYVLQLVPDANHDAMHVVNGEVTGELAPGYVEMMRSWIREVIAGNPPGPIAGEMRTDEHPTRPAVKRPHGFARWEVQLAFFVAFLLLFGGYFLVGIVRRARYGARQSAHGRWKARLVGLLGLTIPWLVFAYTGFISATSGEMLVAVLAGRPAGWLVLQILALILLVVTAVFSISWRQNRHAFDSVENARFFLLFLGAILLIPWAAWWQLYTP